MASLCTDLGCPGRAPRVELWSDQTVLVFVVRGTKKFLDRAGTVDAVLAVAAAGLAGLTFHDLRRANAIGLVSAGIDIKTAQTRLGHSSSRLTLDLYAQSVARLDCEAAEALGEAFMPRLRGQLQRNRCAMPGSPRRRSTRTAGRVRSRSPCRTGHTTRCPSSSPVAAGASHHHDAAR